MTKKQLVELLEQYPDDSIIRLDIKIESEKPELWNIRFEPTNEIYLIQE